MNTTPEHNERFAMMTIASIYPLYLAKVEKKGRTKEELQQVIAWLTGFDDTTLHQQIDEKVTFKTFFERAQLNPKAPLITGISSPTFRNLDLEKDLEEHRKEE